ncbi:MAG: alkane 1-monooxygenase [Defluviimonas sp.]|nr:alkane 1-monooxygenase [Defluviimonas sp.]
MPLPDPAPSMLPFWAATLMPVPLLVGAALWGGGWGLAALGYMTVLSYALDALIAGSGNAPEGAEFPAADALSVTLALLHLALLPLGVAAVAGATGLGGGERVLAFAGFGLFFGHVSNSNAHELIHRGARWLHLLGAAVFVSLLFGHHVSAHRLVHHRHVATAADPNSARAGEGFYRFALRAWAGSFREGLRAETALRARADRRGLHPCAVQVGGALACLAGAALALGLPGLLAWAGLAAHAQMQLLLSDYVQHYGLARRITAGRAEPVGPAHSWDAPQPFSGWLMLHAPRHADHHLHPGRAWPGLRLDREATPMLPRSLPLMAALALVPPLWRRVMDPRLSRWQAAG